MTAPVSPEVPPGTAVVPSASRVVSIVSALLPPLAALLIAAVVGDLLILSFGQSPSDVFRLCASASTRSRMLFW